MDIYQNNPIKEILKKKIDIKSLEHVIILKLVGTLKVNTF